MRSEEYDLLASLPLYFTLLSSPDRFKGKGSGLGLSILKCEKYLREPFVFSSCDTIVKENIPKPNFNWMAAANTKIISSYRSLKILDEKVINIFEKGEMESNFNLPYIGLAGIKDHSFFWKSMKTGRTTGSCALE